MNRLLCVLFLATASVDAFAPQVNSRTATALSATKIQDAKKTISVLTKDNFEASLAEVEPFLLNDAGATIYKKSMRRIQTSAKSFGVEVPADFAKEAKATQKRREKQDAFIQQKVAEAADAETDEAETAEAEPEPVEA